MLLDFSLRYILSSVNCCYWIIQLHWSGRSWHSETESDSFFCSSLFASQFSHLQSLHLLLHLPSRSLCFRGTEQAGIFAFSLFSARGLWQRTVILQSCSDSSAIVLSAAFLSSPFSLLFLKKQVVRLSINYEFFWLVFFPSLYSSRIGLFSSVAYLAPYDFLTSMLFFITVKCNGLIYYT